MSKPKTETPNFAALLTIALSHWPAEIKLAAAGSPPDVSRYTIENLYELKEEIVAPSLGATDEILVSNLHDAIFMELRVLALGLPVIKPAELSPAAVEESFQRRLADTIEHGRELGWTSDDIALARQYL